MHHAWASRDSYLKDRRAVALSVICLAAALLGANEVLVLVTTGVVGILLYAPPCLPGWLRSLRSVQVWLLPGMGLLADLLAAPPPWLDDRLLRLGLFFLKVGSLLFGSGIFIPLAEMAPWARALAYFSPLTYAQDLLNHAVLGIGYLPVWLDLALLPVLLLLFLIPAARLHHRGRVLGY